MLPKKKKKFTQTPKLEKSSVYKIKLLQGQYYTCVKPFALHSTKLIQMPLHYELKYSKVLTGASVFLSTSAWRAARSINDQRAVLAETANTVSVWSLHSVWYIISPYYTPSTALSTKRLGVEWRHNQQTRTHSHFKCQQCTHRSKWLIFCHPAAPLSRWRAEPWSWSRYSQLTASPQITDARNVDYIPLIAANKRMTSYYDDAGREGDEGALWCCCSCSKRALILRAAHQKH